MLNEPLKEFFYGLIAPDRPNEWDVDEQLADYHDCNEQTCREIFSRIPAIWPISHSLCYSYLNMARQALTCLDTSQLDDWVKGILDHYESGGLRAAQTYMDHVESTFLCSLRGEAGTTFEEATGRLLPYARGLIGPEINLIPGPTISTDSTCITLPPLIREFRGQEDNFLFYKLIISYQWAFLALQTLTTAPDHDHNDHGEELWLLRAIRQASDPQLLTDIYLGLETLRAGIFLERELPGLMRRSWQITSQMRPAPPLISDPATIFFHRLQLEILKPDRDQLNRWSEILDKPLTTILQQPSESAQESFQQALLIHDQLAPFADQLLSPRLPLLSGALDLAAVNQARQRKTRQLESRFIDELASFLLSLPANQQKAVPESTEQPTPDPADTREKGDTAMILDRSLTFSQEKDQQNYERTVFIQLDNESIQLPGSLQEQATAIRDHLGHLPDRYLSSAAGRAGDGLGLVPTPETMDSTTIQAPLLYDEWDFRRGGFRRNWCALSEKELPAIRSTFVSTARDRYHGQIIKLRRQFEMLRSRERFVRKQTDGTDIDLDSLVESLADSQAGLAPSDRLFIRLQRNERDIAVLFLVDLSNSTEGWVSTAIKEALVLICEAMETVGDRYGIYGFSGMRRTRCEIFRVKELSESYHKRVKERIGALGPREYTRMGPAIRHMTSLFKGVDARLRLLITLTDGKPEDYDDYKGEYAIEDTRHALIEARSAGIHPFCITIDRQAHEYMGHMYGRGNYIFVDQVAKLPARMTEMYRLLTS